MTGPDVARGRELLGTASPLPWDAYDTARLHVAIRWPNSVRVLATMGRAVDDNDPDGGIEGL